ncbi:MAG TPA: DUF72 domain-containing protein [Verrucomicrobiae bacterium]|nr:DUF72 domain-containing protein [Verrucomicrobiae bacterium]
MASDLRIGTASWTDPGFVADWYPPRLPANARLRWYAGHFNYVEINATFYALPAARTVERWCTETPEDFRFDVKLPRLLSRHRMEAKFLPPDLRSRLPVHNGVVQLTPASEKMVVTRLLRELEPMLEAGKFGAFLLQLSPSFGPKSHQLADLDSLRELLAPYQIAVELRNRDWVTGEQTEQTMQFLRERKLTLVLVDAPQSEHFTIMPGLDCVTNPALGYFRFHGRNAEGYIKGRSVAERFDYDYSDLEAKELAERIRKVAEQVEELRVVANNNRSNFAPKLARKLQELLHTQQSMQRALKEKTPRQAELL